MPTLVVTRSYSDGVVLTEDMLDDICESIETFNNTTKLDDQNLQDGAITTATIATSAVTAAKIDADAVTTSKIANLAVTRAKMATIDAPFIGEVRMMHTFNTTLTLPRGWMKLNGDVVNQTNYETLHGAGTYATDGVAASPLLNKNLPNAISKYPVGVSTTTQNGSSAITYVGNASNQINIQHSHVVDDHNHHWYNLGVTQDSSYASNGTTLVGFTGAGNNNGIAFNTAPTANSIQTDFYTGDTSANTNNAGSTTQSIQPHSFELIYIMKVI